MVRFLAAALSVAAGVAAVHCGDLVYLAEPIIPHDGVSMSPRPEYALWWTLTERCSGTKGDFRAMHWYAVPAGGTFGSGDLEGQENSTTKRIVLEEAVTRDGGVVRHEMLHALIPERGHPAEYFQQKCSGVVDCPTVCLSDGGVPWSIDSTSSIVSVDSVEVSATIDPQAPSISQDSGWFAITVLVTNPYPYPVRVRLAPPGRGPTVGFGWQARACGHAEETLGQKIAASDTLFSMRAREVLRHEFDLQVNGTCLMYQPFFNTRLLAESQVAAVQ